ncbi:M18 family aminopeptidase [Devriesea agamarum]|uniref:M18 family aminopeptidase n=1 Tax=Devriesea agamarum TaxID=472569 RepID=UPI00071E18C7|nr:M18 family aminopeptidase [Devriesea agamarum]
MRDSNLSRTENTSRTAAEAFVTDLGHFVSASPSSFHAAEESARRLEAAGFTRLSETDAWTDLRGEFFVVRDGAIIAWVCPEAADSNSPFHIVGAHTDSPSLKLKPASTIGRDGFTQVGVEVYGGTLLNSWLDRELCLAGRLITRDGTQHLTRTGPMMRVPQLAVHLDRGVNGEGLVLDPQQHMQPVFGLGETTAADVLGILADAAGIDATDVSGYDIVTMDTQPPAIFGADRDFFASPRLDNLSSTHAGLTALIEVSASPRDDAPIAVFVSNDHEEIGSSTRSGAAGPFLEDILVRLHMSLGGDQASLRRAYANSAVISSDAGHSVHPNYPERHDPAVRPVLGGGPLLKINANQRYATDAQGAAMWARICEAAEVPYQEFVSKNTMPCGSTIGPITATRLGMLTVDVGIPLLSMHSVREMCAVVDPLRLELALREFLAGTD